MVKGEFDRYGGEMGKYLSPNVYRLLLHRAFIVSHGLHRYSSRDIEYGQSNWIELFIREDSIGLA